jgi:ATP-dependent DNA ligase
LAIHVDKTLPELAVLARFHKLEITPSGKNQRYMKEDYIYPLREIFLKQRYGAIEATPDHLQLVLNLKSPMLAKRMDALKPQQQQTIWDSDEWYLEEKLNGARMLLVKTGSGIFLYSRHNSEMDLLPIEYSDNILFPEVFNLDRIADNFILDTEITSDSHNLNTSMGKHGVMTETQLQAVTALLNCDPEKAIEIQKQEGLRLVFNVFDCIFYNGQWLLNEPLKQRRTLAMELWRKLESAGLKIRPVRSNRSNKKQFYKDLILNGGEGAVAKNINGIYLPDTNRPSDGWIKIKRSVSEMASMDDVFSDTIDGWISGFEQGEAGKGLENYVGTIKVSCYLRQLDGSLVEHEIAHISGIDMRLREDMTERISGAVTLKPSYYNRVVEIDGAGISPRVRRLNHAVLLSFRYDKNKDSCIIDEEFLNRMIL